VYFQVHVVQCGAVRPMIRMLEASDPRLREMAAFALGHLAQVLIAVALVFALIENLVFLSSTKC
jgi:HEAT repeat protein